MSGTAYLTIQHSIVGVKSSATYRRENLESCKEWDNKEETQHTAVKNGNKNVSVITEKVSGKK